MSHVYKWINDMTQKSVFFWSFLTLFAEAVKFWLFAVSMDMVAMIALEKLRWATSKQGESSRYVPMF